MKNQTIQALFILLVALFSSTTFATTVRTVNLEEMVLNADRVFHGKCVSVSKVKEETAFPVVEYKFQVLEGVKGIQSGEIVVIRQIDSSNRQRLTVPGVPGYKKGDEVFLFLHGDSKIGLTSPVGMTQGVFDLIRDEKGASMAVNGVQNRNLFRQLSDARSQEMGLSMAQFNDLAKGGPVQLDLLKEAVRQIDRFQSDRGRSIQ